MKFRASQIEDRVLADAVHVEAWNGAYMWWGNGPLEAHLLAPPRSQRFRDYRQRSRRWLWVVLDVAPDEHDAFLVVFDPRRPFGEYGIARKGKPIGTFIGYSGPSLGDALNDLHESLPDGMPPNAIRHFRPFTAPVPAEAR